MTSTHNIHFYGEILTKVIATHTYVSSLFIALTSISGICSHCFGLSSPARKAIRSRAVSLVCLLDDTNTRTGLVGEWVLIAVIGDILNFKLLLFYMSCLMGKPTICIGENKDADQLRGNREADQCLCFRYSDSTIPPLLNSKISSF